MKMTEDYRYMARAISIAALGRYSVHPNPAVGCVLVRQSEVVGEGYHVRAGQGHAEANALKAAGEKAKDATAYVTLEPCSFHGRTPSCAMALIEAGVSRVVVAMEDPDPRNAGRGLALLKEAGIEVDLLPVAAAADLVKGHVKRYTQNKPYVRLKLAMTLDGKTALPNGESKWITSDAARADVQKLRAQSAAIVTGVQTVIDDDPSLQVRSDLPDVKHRAEAISVDRPVYVLDSNLRVPAGAGLLSQPGTVLVCVHGSAHEVKGASVISLKEDEGRVDLGEVLAVLARDGHSEVLFECGATLAGSLIRSGLADELVIYAAPRLIGGAGRSLLNLPEIDRMADLVNLEIADIRKVGPDIRITATLA